MRIAQIAPLTEAIPPKHYGGTERVISWLTNELVTLGHFGEARSMLAEVTAGAESGRRHHQNRCCPPDQPLSRKRMHNSRIDRHDPDRHPLPSSRPLARGRPKSFSCPFSCDAGAVASHARRDRSSPGPCDSDMQLNIPGLTN
jgi:hypothetical protein